MFNQQTHLQSTDSFKFISEKAYRKQHEKSLQYSASYTCITDSQHVKNVPNS